jgi:hypothetical protein
MNGRVAAPMFATTHALEGVGQSEAAKLVGMDCQALFKAVVRHNAEGVAGLFNHHPLLKRQIEAVQVLDITLRSSRLATRFDQLASCRPSRIKCQDEPCKSQ